MPTSTTFGRKHFKRSVKKVSSLLRSSSEKTSTTSSTTPDLSDATSPSSHSATEENATVSSSVYSAPGKDNTGIFQPASKPASIHSTASKNGSGLALSEGEARDSSETAPSPKGPPTGLPPAIEAPWIKDIPKFELKYEDTIVTNRCDIKKIRMGKIRKAEAEKAAIRAQLEEDKKQEEKDLATLPHNLDNIPKASLERILELAGMHATIMMRRVNSRIKKVVDSNADLRYCTQHCGNVLRDMRKLDTLKWINWTTMAEAYSQQQCCLCGTLALHLYLVTCQRVCSGCIVREPLFWPIDITQAASRFGLKKEHILHSVVHIKERWSTGAKIGVDLLSALQAGIDKHGSFDKMAEFEENCRPAFVEKPGEDNVALEKQRKEQETARAEYLIFRSYEEKLARAMASRALLPRAPETSAENPFILDMILEDAHITGLYPAPTILEDPETMIQQKVKEELDPSVALFNRNGKAVIKMGLFDPRI